MFVIPAIDLREGACVQLVGGSYEEERVRLDDPLEVAAGWARAGFTRVHVVDLDAATGRGSNAATVRAIVGEGSLEVQVGGGVRSTEAIRELLEAGAARVVVGTRALEEPKWLASAADVRGRQVVTRGWERDIARDVLEVVETLNAYPLAGVMVTAVHREGRMEGTDLELMGEAAARSKAPLYASGGITTMEELRTLATLGVHAAILGMALYTDALDARLVAEVFTQ